MALYYGLQSVQIVLLLLIFVLQRRNASRLDRLEARSGLIERAIEYGEKVLKERT